MSQSPPPTSEQTDSGTVPLIGSTVQHPHPLSDQRFNRFRPIALFFFLIIFCSYIPFFQTISSFLLSYFVWLLQIVSMSFLLFAPLVIDTFKLPSIRIIDRIKLPLNTPFITSFIVRIFAWIFQLFIQIILHNLLITIISLFFAIVFYLFLDWLNLYWLASTQLILFFHVTVATYSLTHMFHESRHNDPETHEKEE